MRRCFCSIAIRIALALPLAGLLAFAGGVADSYAQSTQKAPATKGPRLGTLEQMRAQINENVVTIVSGNPNGGYLGIAYDIAAVTDDGDNLRVLPIVGKGAAQNVRDILFLRGIDMGLVNTVTLSHFKDDPQLGEAVDRRLPVSKGGGNGQQGHFIDHRRNSLRADFNRPKRCVADSQGGDDLARLQSLLR